MDLIEDKLSELANIRAMQEVFRLDYEAKRKAILATVQEDLNDLEAEYRPQANTGVERATELEAEIKSLVRQMGESVKTDSLHAVFSKGRASWDAKGLQSYSRLHPEILVYYTEGDPSVSIRPSR